MDADVKVSKYIFSYEEITLKTVFISLAVEDRGMNFIIDFSGFYSQPR